ncbi:hypothetical protein BCON_0010g00800 [Botryotinia convoluta]|uniref:Uncharacterized protein n=1 Tax=Botryotinia convoluta TaxID=54673 RepID=A0A4Z1ITC4_9HELO|nr:hypothetical protein BCON_0010g00800 [Botryotinia convoluta]
MKHEYNPVDSTLTQLQELSGANCGSYGRYCSPIVLRFCSSLPIPPSPSFTTSSEGIFPFSMESKMRRRGSPPIDNDELNVDISDDSTLLQKAKTRVLLLFDELPEWAKDNEYILSGWRPETNSYRECFKSMGYTHNESGNIYTHSFAALWMIMMGSLWNGYATEWYPATNSDDAVAFFYSF